MRQLLVSSVLAVAMAGAPGAGDPYFPLDGNGGYDVRHYDLAVGYDPVSGVLTGHATVDAVATGDLSTFDLDLTGLMVSRVTVDGAVAGWRRDGGELVITPAVAPVRRAAFTVVVDYSGVPSPIDDPEIGTSGFVRTDDGFVIAGEPHGAATWYPVNDHPSDKATYAFHVTVPNGLTAIANGTLTRKTAATGGRTTWHYAETAPMASYLATVSAGKYDVRSYTVNGVHYTDAVDPELNAPEYRPRTGTRLLYSQGGVPAYRRLSHVVDVPAGGGSLSFWANLNTADSAYLFVEAHTVGADDWTTLPDRDGFMRDWGGSMCDGTLPFLAHYLTREADGTCSPAGTTGNWHGDSSFNYGPGDENEFVFDLADYAGKQIELSITYAAKPPGPGKDTTERLGVFLDDVTVSTGPGTTSFEDDGDTMDGWTVADDNGWKSVTVDQVPGAGYVITRALSRQPAIMTFLTRNFGPYPFTEAGAVVDKAPIGFALETQTRPTYSPDFFAYEEQAVSVVVHEMAHQWFGDAVSLQRWRDIWLNEGFATYAQWLWQEQNGGASAQHNFDGNYADLDADSPFWAKPLDDPGADSVTEFPVYLRGAMALQVLRNRVGDRTFFRILKTWTATYNGGNATSADFQATAEHVAGRKLDDIFRAWVFTAGKPTVVE
ncbi:M1 family metallopeptidase [Paractinoplanes toevensis]|uniref:M1 family metallopeptidase n=1 Tax=Paractinoplanes toevensis TaxID=571911 RepID=UPI001BB3E75B|nr:M1 family metallopeptidase [Actinoplanes toevensis]